jgi:hypothetical protein
MRDGWFQDNDLPTLDNSYKIFSIEISEDEVKRAFLGLDVNKEPGPNGIAAPILIWLASLVKVCLTFIFNLLLPAGVFPAVWKKYFVVPLFKR